MAEKKKSPPPPIETASPAQPELSIVQPPAPEQPVEVEADNDKTHAARMGRLASRVIRELTESPEQDNRVNKLAGLQAELTKIEDELTAGIDIEGRKLSVLARADLRDRANKIGAKIADRTPGVPVFSNNDLAWALAQKVRGTTLTLDDFAGFGVDPGVVMAAAKFTDQDCAAYGVALTARLKASAA